MDSGYVIFIVFINLPLFFISPFSIPLLSDYYAEEFPCSPIYFGFYRIPLCIGLLESVFRAVVNRSRSGREFCPQSDVKHVLHECPLLRIA